MTTPGSSELSVQAQHDIQSVLTFWNEAGPESWFRKDDAFDTVFRTRFLDLHMAIAARQHDDWMQSADGALALLLLLDQFPRNAFRGTAHMFAVDPLARYFARLAIDAGLPAQIGPDVRAFLFLPFEHSEDAADQELSVALYRELGEPWLAFAVDHQAIIARFGRFPHRNAVLGRVSTPEEVAYLAEGGFAG